MLICWPRSGGSWLPAHLLRADGDMLISLRALIVDDSRDDVELTARLLAESGFVPTWKQVRNEWEMVTGLCSGKWDLVLSDYILPDFSCLSAFMLLRRMKLRLPFVILYGATCPDLAGVIRRLGVRDFVAKGDREALQDAVVQRLTHPWA